MSWTGWLHNRPEVQGDLLADDPMLAYFLSTIQVRAKRLELAVQDDPVRKSFWQEVHDALKTFSEKFRSRYSAWNEAYRLERLIALAEPAENLMSEVKRRLGEAADENVLPIERLRTTFEATQLLVMDTTKTPPVLRKGGESQLRSLLLDILEETHWSVQRQHYSRPMKKRATYNIVYAGLGAFVLLLAPYGQLYYNVMYLPPKTSLSFETWSWLPLYTSLTAGLFGALFSRLLYIQRNWNALTMGEIKDARDVTSILLRGCVGMAGAVIVYFFLQSGVLTGALLPDFQQIGLMRTHSLLADAESPDTLLFHLLFPNKQLALLLVWSFLAGFSERLVPSILESTGLTIQGKQIDKK